MPVPGPIKRTVVEVWVVPLEAPTSELEELAAVLSRAERARADAYRSTHDARRFTVARGRLREVLGAALGTSPTAVPLGGGAGKPRLATRSGPHFNVSHAGELALVAVADREVGVDVEPLRSGGRWADVAGLACTPAEHGALRRLPPAEAEAAFLRIWTAKEAYLKGLGVGLGLAPHGVHVGDVVPGTRREVAAAGTPGRWVVEGLRPAPGYVGAVAAEGAAWRVVLRTPAGTPRATAVAGRP